MNHRPPHWMDAFLKWFCKGEYMEEIQGDLYEIFHDKMERKGLQYARNTYILDVLKFFRWSNFKLKINLLGNMMLRSYLKTGIRNFLGNKITSAINVIGLASTISIGIAVYLMIDRQMRLDEFHPDAERIYTVQTLINWESTTETWARTPQLLGKALFEEFPQISHATRVQGKSALVRYNDKIFAERISFADQEFFEIFQFPLIEGTQNLGPNQVIISSRMALKYFKNEDPVGKTLRFVVNQKPHLFTVSGVAEKFPQTASFGFNFMISIDHLPNMYKTDLNSWKNINNESLFTFIKVDQVESVGYLSANMTKFVDLVNTANPEWTIESFNFQELPSIAENSQYTRECYACGSTPEVLFMFAIVSLILFASACFNYINIAVASSGKRLKEIALRKVIGSSRKSIIFQFLVENLILSFMATVLGIILAKTLILPGMSNIFGSELLEMNLLTDIRLITFIVGLFLFIGLCSGAYPAWYISSFEPNIILRGREKFGGKNTLTKVFLTIQFFLTFLAVVSGLIFTQTNQNQKDQEWGYDPENVLVVPIQSTAQYETLNQFVNQSGHIEEFCGSASQIGRSARKEVAETLEQRTTVDVFYIDDQFHRTMGLSITEGRGFDQDLATDKQQSVIVNQKFLKVFGVHLDDKVTLAEDEFRIVGISEDFHHRDFFEPIKPAVFKMINKENARYFTIKTSPNRLDHVNSEIADIWESKFPDQLYDGYVQAYVFDRFFNQTGMLIDVMNFTAIMAIVLSSMGLFGLVSLLIVKRMKELSIRNVLGASRWDSVKLIINQFNWMIGIAIILAIPISFMIFKFLLGQMFLGTDTNISILPFILTLLIIVGTVFLTVMHHLRQLLDSNPVNNLRME